MMRVVSQVAVLVLLAGPAWAWTGTIDWPTFYRAGPNKQFAVLEEMRRGQTVDVLSCQGEWCRVQNGRSIGYIEMGALAPQSAPPVSPGKPGLCFDSRSDGYGRGEVFRYCQQTGG